MAQAKQGDTVNVHYTGKLEDGTVFDTSVGREPLQFTIGGSEVIPGNRKPSKSRIREHTARIARKWCWLKGEINSRRTFSRRLVSTYSSARTMAICFL